MKGARHYIILLPVVLFLALSACKFDEPSLEIIAQEAYDSRMNILIQTRFTAEDDEHTCEYTLVRESDSYVEAADSPVLPADTIVDHLFDVGADGRYLFDFHVLDSGGTPIECLCDEAEFWVDTMNPAAPAFLKSYLHTFTDSSLDYFAVFLAPHTDNDTPETDSPVVFRYDLVTDPTPDSTLYDGIEGVKIPYNDSWPTIHTVAIDRAGNSSVYTDIPPATYTVGAEVIPH